MPTAAGVSLVQVPIHAPDSAPSPVAEGVAVGVTTGVGVGVAVGVGEAVALGVGEAVVFGMAVQALRPPRSNDRENDRGGGAGEGLPDRGAVH